MNNIKKISIGLISSLSMLLGACQFKLINPFETTEKGGDDNKTDNKESDNNKTNTTSEKDTRIDRSVLTIDVSPKLDYYVYDEFDFTGLVVSQTDYNVKDEVLEHKEIDDYTICHTDKTPVQEGEKIREAGYLDLKIIKENCEFAKLSLFVYDVTNFKQSLSITNLPTKSDYEPGETFDPSGLTVVMKTSYKSDTSKTFTEVVEDYTLEVSGQDATNKVFSSSGSYQIDIKAKGWDGTELSAFFTLLVAKKDGISTPGEYDDPSINFYQDQSTVTIDITTTQSTGSDEYYSPDQVINEFNLEDYSKRNAINWKYSPAIGKVPFLIVPVITPNEKAKATDENHALIEKAFFGNSSDLHFESLHSYYYQSSYGQLDITGGVTSYFDPSTVNSKYAKESGWDADCSATIAQMAADWAESTYNIDMKKYDSNGDGFIDGMWLIYLHDVDSNTDPWWGFTSSTGQTANRNHPTTNTYGWAGLGFLTGACFSSYPQNLENWPCDAHVLIHETGHMLGLNDYYSYNSGNYGPLGCVDMMDNNCGDHNAYSKMLYGWTTPYIVYGNARLTIKSSQLKDTVIVIPYDDKQYMTNSDGKVLFNVWDEYLVLEFYTDKNLNSSDYDAYSVNHIQGKGIKLYHADARLAKYTQSGYSYSLSFYSDPDTPFKANNTDKVYQVISNSEGGDRKESSFTGISSSADCYDELRLISADKRYLNTRSKANSNSLFKAGSSFSLSSYSSQFNSGAFNSEKAFSHSFSVVSIN